MSVALFKPAVWSANLLVALRNNLVSENFVNHDYQGEVMGAGSVKINTLGDITVKDYDGSDIEYEELSTTDQTLLIDRQKMFGFGVKDVDKAQVANGGELMIKAMSNSAYKLADTRDASNFAILVEGAGVEVSTTGAPLTVTTPTEAKAVLVKLVAAADKAKVPKDGRKVAIGPEFHAQLLADPYLGLAQPTAEDVLKAGYVGKLFGLEIYNTNNLPKADGGEYVVLSHPSFMTEASQIEHIEALRDTKNFQDLVRGLDVSGAKVIRPQGVIKAVVKYQ